LNPFLRKLTSLLRWLPVVLAAVALCPLFLPAQQTLGGITGEVTDPTGGAIPNVQVTAVGEQTALSRSVKTNGTGVYAFVNLPIGTYTLTFTAEGFEAQKTPHITVQADRTATVAAQLKIGKASETVEVQATPLLNAVDTTNGYVMDRQQIDMAPLATGSFTGLAIQSTGVSAELNGGTGVNAGLGNAPIWANGQRDTSNTFLLNGVDASNLFNGKTTSQVASFRVINNTGSGNSTAGGIIQSSASIYLSVGNSIPSPAPETIEEVRVNASMYDAQQGATAGAHLDISTKSGSNELHGSAYWHRGTSWLNAAPFFFKNDDDIADNQKVPELHREIMGGTVGGALIKDKLFGFVGYQHLHVSDQELGYSRFSVPVGLSDTNRTTDGLAAVANAGWCPYPDPADPNYYCPMGAQLSGGQLNNNKLNPGSSVAFNLMTQPAVKGEPGKWLVPNPTGVTTAAHPYNVSLPGTAYFFADQLVGDVDWNASAKDTLALKYYYQHDPLIAPYAYSNVPGWAQHLDAGSQVFSVNNVNIVRPNLSVTETLGFIREKIYSTNEQPFSADSLGVNNLGSKYYAGVTVVDTLGANTPTSLQTLNIGPGSNQGSLTGVFQNRVMPSANAIWTLGKHTIAVGGSWSHTQLNPRDRRPGVAGTTSSADFGQFVQGLVTANDDFNTTTFLQGNGDRYYRTNQTGLYLQDKFQIRPNLSLTAGVRFDNNGAFSEKYGHLYNFDPKLFDPGTADDPTNANGTFNNNGYVVAQNSSDTTLTGRQWGIGPRVGFAWSPQRFKNKVVVRGGTGFYYDRGELFTYLSPGYAAGEVHGGPFGVSQTQPFVNSQTCDLGQASYYQGYIPTCAPGTKLGQADLSDPWGSTLGAPPTGKASDITQYLPNANAIANGAAPFTMGAYDRKNKLPYSINYTLDVQWQPVTTLAIEIGYVGNLGRHQVIPTPFNQSLIASPGNPIRGQLYSYGYTISEPNYGPPINLPTNTGGALNSTYLTTSEGGNVDLRVPYIGYSSESIDYRAAGISQYNAAQVHVDKRLSHGFQAGASYTFSHATDEQSALGLFYNGDNPNNLRSGYGLADFDRKHVLDFTYSYALPRFAPEGEWKGDFSNGWSLTGTTVLQSGQPFSVIDYSGSVGSVFYSTFDGINNPIVPLAKGCTPKTALTGRSGAFGNGDAFFKPQCFTIPLLNPGDLNGAIPTNDPYETTFIDHGQRNIFRQASQKSANISLKKETAFGERFKLRYTLDVFNLTNTTSLDVTGDNVTQNMDYNNYPTIGTVAAPTGCDVNGNQTNKSFYNCPAGLGITTHTIGSPRQVQMSLRLDF
jgi:hypothetical protein